MQSAIRIILAVETRPPDKHRFTSMIPAHYSINETLYRDGVHFGSQEPEKGAFLHIPGEEPTIAVLKDDQVSAVVHRRLVVITPAGKNGLTLRDFLFPDATTHNFRRSRAGEAYRVKAGSVILVGDASQSMQMAVYCFHAPVQSSTIMRCISSSTTYLNRIWNTIIPAEGPSPLIVTMPCRPTITVPNRQDEGILADYVLLPEPVATISANIGHMIRNSAAGDPAKRMEIMDALIRTLEQQREWARIAERNTKRKHDVEDNPLLKFARLACGEGGK